MNIEDLYKSKRFSLHTHSLGRIQINPMNLTSGMGIEAKSYPLEKMSTREVMTLLVSIVSTAESPEVNANSVTPEQAETLDDDELDQFADLFLQNAGFLFFEYGDLSSKSREGKSEPFIKGRVQIPREENEKPSNYLKRVLTDYAKRSKEHTRKSLDQLSKTLSSMVTTNFGLSKQLSESLSSLSRPTTAILPTPNPAHETNRRLDKVANDLHSLSQIITQTARLIGSLNDLAITWAAEFTRNAQQTSQQTTKTIRIGVYSLLATVFISSASLFLSFKSYQATVDSNNGTGALVEILKNRFASERALTSERLTQLVKEQDDLLMQIRENNQGQSNLHLLLIKLGELNAAINKEILYLKSTN